jgi:hypothetical protein
MSIFFSILLFLVVLNAVLLLFSIQMTKRS